MADFEPWRTRLVALRQLTEALPVVDAGLLRLTADISAVLAVLDAAL